MAEYSQNSEKWKEAATSLQLMWDHIDAIIRTSGNRYSQYRSLVLYAEQKCISTALNACKKGLTDSEARDVFMLKAIGAQLLQ